MARAAKPAEVLTPRAINRALLARQRLLDRSPLPAAGPGRAAQVVQTIEHLVGLQAQAPFPPYYGLHSRLDGFRPDDLAALLTDRSVAATVRDVQAWSGLTGLNAVLEQLRPSLVTFRDEEGAELFDLPTAPRPAADVPAPARLVAEFDNLVLSHAERSRVISAEAAKRLYTINGVIPGPVLIDGFVAGMWRLAREGGRGGGRGEKATVTIEMFSSARERDALTAEAERILAFGAPGAAHDIRFASLTGAGQS